MGWNECTLLIEENGESLLLKPNQIPGHIRSSKPEYSFDLLTSPLHDSLKKIVVKRICEDGETGSLKPISESLMTQLCKFIKEKQGITSIAFEGPFLVSELGLIREALKDRKPALSSINFDKVTALDTFTTNNGIGLTSRNQYSTKASPSTEQREPTATTSSETRTSSSSEAPDTNTTQANFLSKGNISQKDTLSFVLLIVTSINAIAILIFEQEGFFSDTPFGQEERADLYLGGLLSAIAFSGLGIASSSPKINSMATIGMLILLSSVVWTLVDYADTLPETASDLTKGLFFGSYALLGSLAAYQAFDRRKDAMPTLHQP